MSDIIPAIPLGSDGSVLVSALNDRIRRINAALASGSNSSTLSSTPAAATLYGTHLQRINRPVASDASLYVETDRNNLIYQVESTVWKYVFGVYRQTQTQLASLSLGAGDAGLLVATTDTLLLYRWSGVAFVLQSRPDLTLSDTHANRLAHFPSVRYALNQEFWEADRTVRYIVQNAVGTVTVTGGTTVTWNSGNHFINTGTGFTAAQWAGASIVIAGAACIVASVASPTSLTLTAPTANAGPVAYSVASGRWEYAGGKMQQAWANLPADLGENDIAAAGGGFEFFDNVNSLHVWQWVGSAWTWGPGDRHSGEFGQFDADPGTGWHPCDGSVNQTKYAADGTRVTNFTVPDQREFYLKASATYTGSGVTAAAPGLSGNTATAAAAVELTGLSYYDVGPAGAFQNVVEQGVNVIDTGHSHGAGTLAVDTTGTPATFAVLPYYRL